MCTGILGVRHKLVRMNLFFLNRLCLLALALGASTAVMGNAQTPASGIAQQAAMADEGQPPLCEPGLIDGTFTFADQPAGKQTVSLHFENTSKTACRLHGPAGSSFAVDGHSMVTESCWLCDANGNPSTAPEQQPGNQILLAPGGRATLDLQWDSVGESCQWADWVDFQFYWVALPNFDFRKITSYLFSPSGWPLHICSAVRSSGYRAGSASPSTGEPRDGLVSVSVLQNTIYNDERVTLHVELTGQAKPAMQPVGCADIYTVRQGPSIGTRLDPLPTLASHLVPSFAPEQIQEDQERPWPSWKKDHLRRCNIEAGKPTADAEINAVDLANLTHIEWSARPASGKDPIFLTTSTHFTVLDVDTLAPNWGEMTEGIHAGLSVDQDTFSAGERIPLHIRWDNVNASKVLGQGECGDPQPVLEVQDSRHKLLRTIPMDLCLGHGWGPFTIEKGKAQHDFRELSLTEPGVYYLVSVWSPRVLEAVPDTETKRPRIGGGSFGSIYATARSLPVRIEVVPSKRR